MVSVLNPKDASKILPDHSLETNMLEMILQGCLGPGEPIVRIAEKNAHLPPVKKV